MLTALPVVIIGGYLGAGKTTLINHVLRNAGGRRVAVLVNDFGEINIDADLIEGATAGVLSLSGGCLCCSFGDDLVGTLQALAQGDGRPDVVLIELSARYWQLLGDYGEQCRRGCALADVTAD